MLRLAAGGKVFAQVSPPMPQLKASLLTEASDEQMVDFDIPELVGRTEDFQAVYCKRFDCRPEKFEERFFWEVMEPDKRHLAMIFRLIPGYFRRDFEIIRRIATSKKRTDITAIANRLPFTPRFNKGFFRGFLGIRISDRLLMLMAHRVF